MTRLTGKKRLQMVLAVTMAFSLIAGTITNAGMTYAAPAAESTSTIKTTFQTPEQVQSHVKYEIDAKLDTDNMTITGKQTVTYRNTSSDKLNDVVFHLFADAHRSKDTQAQMFARTNEELAKQFPDKKPADFLGGIDITDVKDSTSGRTLTSKNEQQALTVQLEKPLLKDEEVTIVITYKTKIPFGAQRLSYQKDIINGAHWFPVMSVYNEQAHTWNKVPYSTTFESDYYDVADYNVHLNVPDKLQLAMPGQMSEQPAEAGRKIVSTKSDKTREFVFFSSEKYHKASKTKNGLTVEYVYYNDKNDPAKTAVINQYMDRAFAAIEFFSSKFGKYDYPDFRIVESHVEGVAVEFSRMIQMGLVSPNAVPANDSAFVHEIAHQWFHSIIGNNSEKESFLDEGFADFAMTYFYNEQGNKSSGFDGVRFDDYPMDVAINSDNHHVGDSPDAVYYKKGRLAIYELYRMAGPEKFDTFMKEYFNRYAYRNATVSGLLQTIEDQLGKSIRDRMDDNLNKPNFELKPEYQMSEAEKQAFMKSSIKQMYDGVDESNPQLPKETMYKLMSKTLRDEPLTIIVGDPASKKAKAQQDMLATQLQSMFQSFGMKANIINNRQTIKKQLETTLAKSNVIVIGNPKHNAFTQALQAGIITNSAHTGFAWKETMSKSGLQGAYGILHPYNKERMVVHYFWTDDHISKDWEQPFIMGIGHKTLMVTNHFYQFIVQKSDGSIWKEKKIENPIAKLFENTDDSN
ncbi:M1 family metallopeptidase [Paenibacillus sp. UMB4589-SE434]|uniref:M1 family metallopeptidase n=1 Tax=Paenibacillus sp. UMB4589-SE434 TaxID=3046314 RepID=UPI00254B6272|nr:M1 family metallopeptidase [Paenibacillus sp. UMB4589-SE434]MDK8181082.1 M1 family metallopeptidase [Paenibacillus sp. UMB4589-SE434]